MSDALQGTATLSPDGRYRYILARKWQPARPALTVVMLNPSTADASTDDPTIRRCIGFARAWGFGRLVVLNLYALRATQPRDLWTSDDPVGPLNDVYLRTAAGLARAEDRPVLAAWGANARPERVADVTRVMAGAAFVSLGTTKDGHPRHPLYIAAATRVQPWTFR